MGTRTTTTSRPAPGSGGELRAVLVRVAAVAAVTRLATRLGDTAARTILERVTRR